MAETGKWHVAEADKWHVAEADKWDMAEIGKHAAGAGKWYVHIAETGK